MSTERRLTLALIALGIATAAACVYDPPPEVKLDPPPTGTFTAGDPLVLSFSEPIDPTTLKIRIWPDLRDIEGELPPGTAPLLVDCDLASDCGTTEIEVDDDGLSAQILLDPEDLGQPDVPLLLEIRPGLSDLEGRQTGAPSLFDFQFKPAAGVNDEPVTFDNGHYIILSIIEEPLPAILTLSGHFIVTEDGLFALAGGEVDNIEGSAKNTSNPDELFLDTTEDGFAIFAVGQVSALNGERFIESDPFDVNIKIGPVGLTLRDVRISGKINKNPDTGKDQISGTLSFAGLVLNSGNSSFDYPAGTTTFSADHIPEDKLLEGSPDLCADLCGAVIAQCTPPANFPPEGICP